MNKFKNKKILNTVLKKEFSKRNFSFEQKFVCSVFSEKNSFGAIHTNKQKFLKFEPRSTKQFFRHKNLYNQTNQTHSFGFLFLKQNFKTKLAFQKENTLFFSAVKNQKLSSLFVGNKNSLLEPIFLNFAFDKNRLKNIVAWFLERYGQYKTIQFLEKLKEFGFGYATKGGLSLGIDDLKIPNNKISLIAKAETKVSKDLMDFRNAKITGVERMQRLIYTWNQTNDMLKQEVIKYFETIDLFNPIYMMAFSGARGNMSQVRQLVGMRGLMSDPQGQIIDFPIQSNFREGLTLTEYLISTYGARKGIVDTALRTATAGYLTRRLVDVAQHVIVSQFDCETSRGIFLFDMKEANKTIYSFQNRLVGRVLAQDIFSTKEIKSFSDRKLIASRNQEIDSKLAFAISKVTKKALVRSPLTCETPRLICQLCYGWSLSQGKLVSVGEAVGVIAAQSIGEPGTQLTMRTFHTGGVFAGGLTDQILAPFDGKIQYFHNIPGSCIRISLSEIAFFTKTPGSFCVIRGSKASENIHDLSFNPHSDETYVSQFENHWKQKNKNSSFSEIYKIPAYAVLFMRNHEFVQKKQVLAQFSTVAKKQLQYGSAEQTLYSILAGEFYLSTSSVPFQKKDQFQKLQLLIETKSSDSFDLSPLELKNDVLWKVKDWTNLWILSGKVLYNSFDSNIFIKNGDFLKKTTALNRILWKKTKTWNLFGFQKQNDFLKRKKRNMFYSMALENFKNSKPFPFFVEKSWSNFSKGEDTSLMLNSAVHKNNQIFPIFSLRKNKKRNTSLFNIWKISSKQKAFEKKLLKNNKKSLKKNNLTWKIFFDFSKKTSIFKYQLLPFKPFAANFKNSYKKQVGPHPCEATQRGWGSGKNQKFLKPEKDIIFSGNFQRFFVFAPLALHASSPPTQRGRAGKKASVKKQTFKNLNCFIYKRKNPLKQIFFKFSTFAQNSPSFRIYHFAKKFNASQKFVKKALFAKNFFDHPLGLTFYHRADQSKKLKVDEKNYLLSKFLFSKKYSTKIFYKSEQLYLKERFCLQKTCFCFKTKTPLKLFSVQKRNKSFQKSFSFGTPSEAGGQNFSFLFSTYSLKFPFFNALNFFQSRKKTFYSFLRQRYEAALAGQMDQNLTFQKTNSQKIILKKTLFCLNYEKVRYKKFAYVFSFFDSSTTENDQNSQLFFRTFTTLKQTIFDENKKANLGKLQTSLAIGNENFFGKDIPIFLTYCFPKNYQTKTNGIFTIFVFENLSKKQKFTQFLCVQEKCLFDFFKIIKAGKNQNKKDDRKKNHFSIQSQKNLFLTFSPFSCVLQNKSAFFENLFSIQKTKNVFENSFRTNFQQKELFPNSFLNLNKRKDVDYNNLKFDLFFGLSRLLLFTKGVPCEATSSVKAEQVLKLQNKLTFNRFNFELYTEEIFWMPQENYTFSVLNFSNKDQNNFGVKRKENFKEQKKEQMKSYVFDIIFQKMPLFYSSNRQGIKKLFFPFFEGIWRYSTFSNQIKYQQSSSFQKKNFSQPMLPAMRSLLGSVNGPKNNKKLQQKMSFYQHKNKKVQYQRKNASSFFYSFKKNKKTKYVQKISLQKKNLALRFLQWKFLFQNFSKTKMNRKNFFVFKQKNRRFFKFKSKAELVDPKFYFSKKFNKQLKTNISLSFFKNKQNKSNFQKSQKIFVRSALKLQQSTVLKKVKIQDTVGQYINSNCFTCFPLQKFNQNSSFSSENFLNQFGNTDQPDDPFAVSHIIANDSFQSNLLKRSKLDYKQIHLTIQSGWLCIFENSSFVLNSHQTTAQQGQFFAKDLSFEQNKIFKEAILLKKSRVSSKPQNMILKQISLNSEFKSYPQKNKNFSVTYVQKNLNCRFQNNESLGALDNFAFHFEENQSFNSTQIFDGRKKIVQNICFNQNQFQMNSKFSKQNEKLALFLRPIHYKLVENPKNYKKSFLNATIRKSSQKNSIPYSSSLKIYKKYHSTLLNSQHPQKNFLHHCKNPDSFVSSAFEKMHSLARSAFKFRKILISKMAFLQTFRTSFKKNQSFLDFRLSKKDTFKKSLNFKLYSKKTVLSNFRNVLNRDFSKYFSQQKDQPQNLNLKHTSFQFSQKNLVRYVGKNCQNNYFFSFYPIQFLPLSISHSAWTNSSFHFQTSQTSPTLFFNAINSTIDFSMCEKKAVFLNQRFAVFKKSFSTVSFWLNKDGLKFIFPEIFDQKTSNNFWKQSFSVFLNKNTIGKNKKNFFSMKSKSLKTTQIVQNFIFKKNPVFYANTKFVSPFEGELIPMHMNETNWWKKASEISTIQKLNSLFSVVTTNDLFTLDFLKTNYQNKKQKNSEFLTLSQQNGKNQDFVKIEKKEKYFFENKQRHLLELYKFVLNKQKIVEDDELSGLQKQFSQIGLPVMMPASLKNDPLHSSQRTAGEPNVFKDNSVFGPLRGKKQKTSNLEISSFHTKYENKIYTFKNLKIGYPKLSKKPILGKFFVYGDCLPSSPSPKGKEQPFPIPKGEGEGREQPFPISKGEGEGRQISTFGAAPLPCGATQRGRGWEDAGGSNLAIRKPGQIVHISSSKITLRRGQPFLVSPKGILHFANTPYIQKNIPILTLAYQTVQSGDIVQGIPKVEQLFEARTTIQGRLFLSSLPILLKGIFERYKTMLPLEQAVRQSFLKIQQLIVDGVQRVYRSQGVSIVDKHLEVIVRQMTTKVQILHGAQTGFFPGELVNLDLVERINKFLLVKIRYEPVVLGITRSSLEVDSFLSASSFQQTTKILALASISRKKDFLKGLKENILVGNLMPSGTGYMVLRKNV
uniref:RNA polymerase beta'' subunit n=1 Tax=Tetradesmus distendus TaxID=113531 RepID=UPI003001AA2A|nr:RNA polymerase beta'' subunit [Tetradesmus distendus]